MVSPSVYLGNLCCRHCSALTRDPTWDGAILLSAPENLATGSSRLVPLLRLSSGEESLLMHVMPPPWDSPSPKSGPGRGRPALPLASNRDNSDGPPQQERAHPCIISGLQSTSSTFSCVLHCLWVFPRKLPINLLHPNLHLSWVYFSGNSNCDVVKSNFSCG